MRVFELDMDHCPDSCGELALIAAILELAFIENILAHLGRPARAPRLCARGHIDYREVSGSQLDYIRP